MLGNSDLNIICGSCGHEFRSAFSGAALVVGCSETCPKCGVSTATPNSAGGVNFAKLNQASSKPMIRQFNNHDYIYLGRGLLEHEIQHPELLPIRAAYTRNMDRVFTLFDIYEESLNVDEKIKRIPSIFSSILILTRTSYEVLINDLFEYLNSTLLWISNKNKFRSFYQREQIIIDNLANHFPSRKDMYAHKNAIKYLTLFRNVLAHNGGYVDKQFREKIRKLNEGSSQTFENLNDGDLLPLDLSLVTSLCDSVQQLSHNLLRSGQNVLSS